MVVKEIAPSSDSEWEINEEARHSAEQSGNGEERTESEDQGQEQRWPDMENATASTSAEQQLQPCEVNLEPMDTSTGGISLGVVHEPSPDETFKQFDPEDATYPKDRIAVLRWEGRPTTPACLSDRAAVQTRMYELLTAPERIQPLLEDYMLSVDMMAYQSLRDTVGEPPRNWNNKEWLDAVHRAATDKDAPLTTRKELQRQLRLRMPKNARLVTTMRQLAELTLELPETIVARMSHRHVNVDTLT